MHGITRGKLGESRPETLQRRHLCDKSMDAWVQIYSWRGWVVVGR
jgi:hypothetical protein